jgi:tRNA threonylcarbamoyladenosine biosynthesis protein TsaB
MSEGAVLAIDTAFGPIGIALCSSTGEMIASEAVANALGAQAEKLPPLVEQMFAKARFAPKSLARIAVTVGPGAFTGVRVGLAFAKGLALALKIPLLGFTTLECLAAQAHAVRGSATTYASVIDARRGEFYAQGFDGRLKTVFGPSAMTASDLVSKLGREPGPLVLAGSGAAMIANDLRGRDLDLLTIETIDARSLVLAACSADPRAHPPVPCYLRAPDARLPS